MVGVGSVSREYVKRLFVLKEYQVINGCGNDSQGRGIGSSILKRLLSLHDSKYPSDVFPLLFFLSSHYRWQEREWRNGCMKRLGLKRSKKFIIARVVISMWWNALPIHPIPPPCSCIPFEQRFLLQHLSIQLFFDRPNCSILRNVS